LTIKSFFVKFFSCVLVLFCLTGCDQNFYLSDQTGSYQYPDNLTHLAIRPQLLPSIWQELPANLLTSFTDTEKNYLSSFIKQAPENAVIHYYWTTQPNHTSHQAVAFSFTATETDQTVPASLSYYHLGNYQYFSQLNGKLPHPEPDNSAAITIYHLQNQPDSATPQNITYHSLLSFIDTINKLAPVGIYSSDQSITIGHPVDQTPMEKFNFSFVPQKNKFTDIQIINLLQSQLAEKYINSDIFTLPIENLAFDQQDIKFTFSDETVSQQGFEYIKQNLAGTNEYEIAEKILPDNSTTSIIQTGTEPLSYETDQNLIKFHDFNNQPVYVQKTNRIISVTQQPDHQVPSLICFSLTDFIDYHFLPIDLLTFETITFDPSQQNGIIKL